LLFPILEHARIIFILLSIKTRIETTEHSIMSDIFPSIFILLSIKTRIETFVNLYFPIWQDKFLSYYPLKQGLKPVSVIVPAP